jgi:hypothetical protein
MPTGKCVNSTIKKGTKVCEIKGWCPLGINILTFILIKLNLNYIFYFQKMILRGFFFKIEVIKDINK